MSRLTKTQFLNEKEEYLELIQNAAVFIYPTDTIYGIGCNATNDAAVRRVRTIKQREDKPFSVIAPSKDWIMKHAMLSREGKKWLENLPGPYTLIVKLKDRCVAPSVNNDSGTLGVRIPDHWIAAIATEADVPLVTTSVNISGQAFATSINDIDPTIIDAVDFVIDQGTLPGTPSTIVDLTGEKPVVKKR